MRRRGIVTATIAVAAAGSGIGWQLRKRRAGRDDEIGRALWSRRFEQPDGGWLMMAERRGKPLLLNLWATWCPPCVAEMPLLDRFHRQRGSAGWQVVGLALDRREPVQRFLAAVAVGFPIGLAGADGVELARVLGNAGGQLPFTAVFDAAGALRDRKLGIVEAADLDRWAAGIG